MLALDRPLGVVSGVVLFGDHADEARVYYTPTRPRMATLGAAGEPGQAELSLVRLRGDDPLADGGTALLSFTTELAATDEQLQEAREHLVRQGIEQPVLTAFPWRAGKAVLAAALQEGDGFVETMLGEVRPDLLGSNRAVFSLRLTEAGAALVSAMLDDEGPSVLRVRYELEYEGLRPALQVRLRADYSRIYDELSWGFQAGVAYQGVGVRVGVESAIQELIEEGAIQVEVLRFTDDADLRQRVDEAVRWLQERILEDMFESRLRSGARDELLQRAIEAAAALGAGSLSAAVGDERMLGQLAESLGVSPDLLRRLAEGGQGSSAAGSAGGSESTFALNLEFSLRDLRQEELRVVTLDWSEARAETRSAAPQGLLANIGPQPRVIEADETDDLWRRLVVSVRPLGDFRALGVERLVVQLAHPDEHDPRATRAALVFEPGASQPQTFGAWTDGRPPRYRSQTEVHFAEEGAWPGPPVFTGPWVTRNTLALAVHPLVDVPRLELELSPGTVRFEDTPQVRVDVQLGDETIATEMLTAQAPRAIVRRRLPPSPTEHEPSGDVEPPRLRTRTTWFLPGGWRTEGEWEPVEGSVRLVPAPWRSHRTVRVLPLLPPDFIEASVTISITESVQTRSQTVRLTPDDRGPRMVSLPALAEQPPPASVEVLVIRGDGSTFVARPYETTDPVVLVRDREGEHRRVRVQLLAGERLAEHALLAVQVQLLNGEGEVADAIAFTEARREPQVLLVPVDDDGELRYRYRVVRYAVDGSADVGRVGEATVTELLVPARPGPA